MARKDWATPDAIALARDLHEQPYKYGFSAIMRRLECLFKNKPRLGKSLGVKDDAVRLAQEPSMVFAPSTLASFDPENEHAANLAVYFFGLFGPNGPLPHHLTEYARERRRNHDDPTFIKFADIFHHRLLSLFYRAWANAQPTISFERPESDHFSKYVGALFGLGLETHCQRDELPDMAKLFFAGQMSSQSRHPEGLMSMIHYFFHVPVKMEEFVGTWFPLPSDAICLLGVSEETGTLGHNAVIGGNVWSSQQKFRLTFGPLTYKDFQRFLPGGTSLKRLIAIIKNYLGDEMAWDLRLILKKEDIPKWKLGNTGCLGWTTRLTNKPIEKDIDEVLLHPVADFGY